MGGNSAAVGQPEDAPRAYRLPFDEALAEQSRQVLERLQGGQVVNGYVSQQPPGATPAEELVEAGNSTRRALAADAAVLRIEFKDVRRPALPAKGAPSG